MQPPSADETGRREALIVAADRYADPKLRALRAPARDAEELARVLADPNVGDFQVGVSLNEADHVVRRKVSEFFRDRGRDDLLLLHVSCHGLKDEDGTLYFASSNTAVEHLEATAIPSEFVNRQMTKSRSRRIVLLLDCCFGGAFARGLVHRAGETVALKEEFSGQGRVVLTASRAMEYAFEGENREGDAQPSIFTSAIVHGLESGEADRDGDSRISIDELYDYVYDRVRESTPNQTPSKWTFDVHGDLHIARSPFREPEPTPLPVELRAAIESPFAHVRAGAVEELARLLVGADRRLGAAARVALEDIANDDSKRVSEAALAALAAKPRVSRPVPVVVAPPPPEPAVDVPPPAAEEPPREPSGSSPPAKAPRAARWGEVLAFAGSVLLVLGYFERASWDTSWKLATLFSDGIWAVWSPAEAIGGALLVAWAARASRTGRIARAAKDGILLAVGLMVAVATVAFLGSSLEFAGAARVTAFGAAALIAAAALGLVTGQAAATRVSRRLLRAAPVGIALGLSPLVVNLAYWESSLLDDWGWPSQWPFVIEVLAAGIGATLALLVLIRIPKARLPAGGAFIGIGAMLVLHIAGVIVELASDDDLTVVRFGGPLGIAGGLLLIAIGLGVVRAERRANAPAAVSLPAS